MQDVKSALAGHSDAIEGFTLLEILLVILILSVTTMMVAPSFISFSSPGLQQEAKRMVQILRLASEESMLSGRALRLSVLQESYRFETPASDGTWLRVEDKLYSPYHLPSSFQFTAIRPEQSLDHMGRGDDEEPLIGHINILPDGFRRASELTLAKGEKRVVILIQPGPDGVRIQDHDSGG